MSIETADEPSFAEREQILMLHFVGYYAVLLDYGSQIFKATQFQRLPEVARYLLLMGYAKLLAWYVLASLASKTALSHRQLYAFIRRDRYPQAILGLWFGLQLGLLFRLFQERPAYLMLDPLWGVCLLLWIAQTCFMPLFLRFSPCMFVFLGLHERWSAAMSDVRTYWAFEKIWPTFESIGDPPTSRFTRYQDFILNHAPREELTTVLSVSAKGHCGTQEKVLQLESDSEIRPSRRRSLSTSRARPGCRGIIVPTSGPRSTSTGGSRGPQRSGR